MNRPEAQDEAATGLPWPTTWPGVYRAVIAAFVLEVALLHLLRTSYP